jgi:predicted nuclease of restriction endonuclease-like (RecB) superfamily
MRQFARIYSREHLELVGQIPWGHNQTLLNRINSLDHRLWYAQKTLEHGWSRSVLEFYIDGNLYAREGKAITNFKATLPAPQSDLAQQVTRDPYCFDFLTLRKDYIEKELEGGLSEHVRKMLMALGTGFAYLGNQYPITVDGTDFFIDMLFFHVKLNCFVVVELKAGAFKPEYAGKLNFYLSAVDDLVRQPNHNPTIGLLLCKDKGGKALVKYSLQDIQKPMGVSSYTTNIADKLPEDLESSLPSREELAARLDREFLEDNEEDVVNEAKDAEIQGDESRARVK